MPARNYMQLPCQSQLFLDSFLENFEEMFAWQPSLLTRPRIAIVRLDSLNCVTDVRRNTISQHKIRGEVDPESLESVVLYLVRYGSLDFRRKILDQLLRREVPADPGGHKKRRGEKVNRTGRRQTKLSEKPSSQSPTGSDGPSQPPVTPVVPPAESSAANDETTSADG